MLVLFIVMPRKLDERDIEIFRKLVPELNRDALSPAGHQFKSILPPMAHHFTEDEDDFKERLDRLSGDDIGYLVGKVLDGGEMLGSLDKGDIEVFVGLVESKVSKEQADKVREYVGLEYYFE